MHFVLLAQSFFMKKFLFPVMLIAIGIAFYEQSMPHPNQIITAISFVVFMVCLMFLGSKIPNKNPDTKHEERG
jgi:Na+/citrate or Na+/malate symporter